MRTTLVLGFVLLSGCAEEYTLPKEACLSSVGGQNIVSEPAVEAMLRTNCYRRFVGLPKLRADGPLSAAGKAHSEYLVANFDAGLDSDPLVEDPNQVGFTGETVAQRVESQGFVYPEDDYKMFELTVSKLVPDMPSYAVVDYQMDDPLLRQLVLQPSIYAAGYGESGDWAVFTYVYLWPPAQRVGKPIVYPGDGQLDVPLSSVAPFNLPNDDAPALVAGRAYGYPITITVGSTAEATITQANPWEMSLLNHSLTGPDGDVDAVVVSPATAGNHLESTIVIWPLEPLEPSADYHVTGAVGWANGPKDFDVMFTTMADDG